MNTQQVSGFLENITLLLRRLAVAEIGLVSVVEQGHHSVVSFSGPDAVRDKSHEWIPISDLTIQKCEPIIVENASSDQLQSRLPALHTVQDFQFYVCVPLISSEGHTLGSLLASDREPHSLSLEQMESLRSLAALTSRILDHLPIVERHSPSGGSSIDDWLPSLNQVSNAYPNLISRDHLLDALEHLVTQESAPAFALLRCRLREYDRIFATLGFQIAEEFVAEGLRRILAAVPRNSNVARFSDAEILVLLPDDHEQDALLRTIERLIAFCSQIYRHRSQVLSMNLAIGATKICSHDASVAELLADTSMGVRRALSSAGSTYHCVDADRRLVEQASYRMESELRDALFSRQMIPYLQPIVNLGTGEPIGFEALARWPRGDQVLTPSSFLPQLCDAGITGELDLLIVERTLELIPQLAQPIPRRPMSMSLNHSALLLENEGLRRRILRLIDANPLPLGWTLQIELLEDAFRDTSTGFEQFLAQLAERGVAIAIDDFGTGYSSLARLISLPIQVVKIDRAFVRQLEEPGDSPRTLLRTMISMLKDLGLSVTAEGVESRHQQSWLLDEGVQKAQGYLFHQPLPIDDAIALLEELPYRSDALPVDPNALRTLRWLKRSTAFRIPWFDRRRRRR